MAPHLYFWNFSQKNASPNEKHTDTSSTHEAPFDSMKTHDVSNISKGSDSKLVYSMASLPEKPSGIRILPSRYHYATEQLAPETQRADTMPERWLLLYDSKLEPQSISCRLAFDTFMYCLTPVSQLRNLYRTGEANDCKRQINDLHMCFQFKALAYRDSELATKLLRERSLEPMEQPHIWNFRTRPARQFAEQMEIQKKMNKNYLQHLQADAQMHKNDDSEQKSPLHTLDLATRSSM